MKKKTVLQSGWNGLSKERDGRLQNRLLDKEELIFFQERAATIQSWCTSTVTLTCGARATSSTGESSPPTGRWWSSPSTTGSVFSVSRLFALNNSELGIRGFAVLRCDSNSYFQAILTLNLFYLWARPITITYPKLNSLDRKWKTKFSP